MGQGLLVESSTKIIRRLNKHNFILDRSNGSHQQYKCKEGCHTATVPVHKGRDLTKKETMSIIRQTGLTKEEFYA